MDIWGQPHITKRGSGLNLRPCVRNQKRPTKVIDHLEP